MKKIYLVLATLLMAIISINPTQAQIISTVAGTASRGYSGDGGPATTAVLNNPNALLFDNSGNLYVSDASNHTIRKISVTGVITTIAGTGSAGFSGDGGQATAAQLRQPFSMAFDASGNMIFCDAVNHRLRKINTSGVISTIAGSGTPGYGGDGGAASTAQLNTPSGIVIDGSGNIIFADQQNNRIRKISTSGIITTIVGTGTAGSTGDGGAATAARLWLPNYIYLDVSGNLYISDNQNHKIRMVNTSGIINLVAGNGSATYAGDGGVATAASINYPGGITKDAAGNLYIADFGNHRIRMVNTSGIISTYAGTGSGGFSGDGGAATAAQINNGVDVVIGATTELFIADYSNHRVRKIGNSVPSFASGASATMLACVSTGSTGGTATAANNFLKVNDLDAGQTISWVVLSNPGHGSLSGFPYRTLSTTTTVTPSGLNYTPTSGYTGLDSFKVRAYDSTTTAGRMAADTITVYVQVSNAWPITGPTIVTVGSSITLVDSTAGGTWSSGTPSIATITSTGTVWGISPGTVNIYYTGASPCGTYTMSYTVTVTPAYCTPTYTSAAASCTTYRINITTFRVTGSSGTLNDVTACTGSGYENQTGISTLTCTMNLSSSYTATIASGGTSSMNAQVWIDFNSNGTFETSESVGGANAYTYLGTFSLTIPSGASTGVKRMRIVTDYNGSDPSYPSISPCATGCTFGDARDYLVTISSTPFLTAAPPSLAFGCGTIGSCSAPMAIILNGNYLSPSSGSLTVNAPANYSVSGSITGSYASSYTITYTSSAVSSVTAYVKYCPVSSGTHTGSVTISGGGLAAAVTVPVGGTVCAACAGTPTAGVTTASVTIGCSAFNSVLYLTGSTAGTGINYQWQISTDGSFWSNISGSTLNAHNATVTSNTYYRCAVLCAGMGVTSYSTPILLTVGTPVVNRIFGPSTACMFTAATYTDSTAGGTWSISNTSLATITSGGLFYGLATGVDTIYYTVSNGCGITVVSKVVNITSTASAGAIVGPTGVCIGSTITLTDSVSGGTWVTYSGAVTIDSFGQVTGVAAGSATISYTVTNSCGTAVTTHSVSVSSLPYVASIRGSSDMCAGGSSVTLTDSTAGGVWTSVTPAIATVSTTGVVTPLTAGTDTIKYTVTSSCGSAVATKVITVSSHPVVSAITGPTTVCIGSLITLADSVSGGTWTSSAPTVATINGSTGVLYGMSAGSATISYSKTNICGTARATFNVSVGTTASAGSISGAGVVCTGSTISLTDGVSGGTWSSNNASIATVSTTGSVTGVATGTAIITYTVSGTCGTAFTTHTVVVSNPVSAGTISGLGSVCTGSNITLTNAVTGGTWSSSNTTLATVNTTGVVYGVTSGSVLISYTVTGSCNTAVATHAVTVNSSPVAGTITGPDTICVGSTGTKADTITGGVWASSNTTVATINSAGVVTGLTAGIAYITYSVTSVCGTASATSYIVVAPGTSAGTISGAATVCIGSTTTLSPSSSGGTWSSSNTSVATVSSAGVVSGLATGSVTISYSVSGSCGSGVATHAISVTSGPSVAAITGPTTVCPAATITLADATAGGTWSSSNTARATVNSSGVVTGVAAGAVTISYTVSGSCGAASATYNIAVNAGPSAGTISGTTAVCVGSVTTLSNAVSGGTWSTSNASVASIVAATGVLRGITAGAATITYSITTSCGTATTTAGVSVISSATAGTITGPTTVCAANTITLSDAISGGTWSSSNTAVATVNGSGVVSGLTAGAVTVSYTVASTCGTAVATYSVTVNPAPNAGSISGPSSVCTGATITLTDAVSGGTWSSSTPAVATVSATGVVRGVSAGATTITYSVTNSCGTAGATATVTVLAPPTVGAIAGSTTVCPSSSSTLTNTTAGGTWTSSSPTVATISTSGVVTGVSVGSATITYTVTNACGTASATITINVSTTPSAGTISGTTTVCAGATTTLTDGISGGTWSSSNTAVATVSASGTVTGVSGGTATISYRVTNSCGSAVATAAVTVNPLPFAGTITGTTTVCTGASTTLSNTVTGGTWSTSSASVASISATGVVTGVSAGTATISYTLTNSCGANSATTTVTVNTVPSAGALSGTSIICTGGTVTISTTGTGGTWSSSNPATATVNSSGIVTGVTAGSATISYSVTNSCGTGVATMGVTVNTAPSAGTITGTTTICQGNTTTLADAVAGGTWSTSNAAVATINSVGIVRGMSPGTATISYSITGSCGTVAATATVTVNPAATAGTITGAAPLCPGSSLVLSDSVAGGAWSSSNTSIATVSTSGVVTAIAIGTTTITYTITNSCGTASATTTINVSTGISAGTISGPATVCQGSVITLSDAVVGGVWSTSSASVASVNSTTGVVTGMSAGTAVISYTVSNSCGSASATQTVTVNPAPSAATISGTTTLCTGTTATLSASITGGTWSSSNPSVASITATGVVRGNTAGTAIVTYTVTNSCGTASVTTPVTVTTGATAGIISGATSLCSGTSATLSASVAGGAWGTSNAAIATVSSAGVVTALSSGTAVISYGVSSTCGTAVDTSLMIVTLSPSAGTITGTTAICIGTPSTLGSSVTGGSWSSSNPSIATVNATGVVTGVAAGSATITYTVSNSCGTATATTAVSVNSIATAGTISGSTALCTGTTTTLSSSVSGGTWSSSNPSVATVSATGVVSGMATGSAVITYSVTSSCGTRSATATVTVSTTTSAGTISGTTTVCAGASATLTSTVTGGSWSSSNNTVATINASGVVGGVSAGTAIITYFVSSSCGMAIATTTVTVNPAPDAGTISGAGSICTGGSLSLSSSVAGGAWSSGSASVATVTATGVVTGLTTGAAIITYSVTNSCGTARDTALVTVGGSASAGTISGPSAICTGSTGTYSGSVSGGSWSSSNPSVVTISTSGIATGLSTGSATITYSVSGACGSAIATNVVTVSAGGSAGTLSGASSVCQGSTVTFASTITGGTWSTSNASIASVHATTGVVSGIGTGSATITYTITGSCGAATATRAIAVNGLPSSGSVSGPATLCIGAVSVYSVSASGGTWSSSNAAIASVNASGTVRGNAAGTAILSYMVTNSCGSSSATASVTITTGATAGTISGSSFICLSGTATLSSTVAGGTWSSGAPGVASINTAGVVSGISVGTAVITYSVTSSCGSALATYTVTVGTSASAGTISGPSSVCRTNNITLTASVSGGTWSSSNAAIASVDATGNVNGISVGTATITYAVSTSCGSAIATKTVTVNAIPVPGTVSGPASVCAGSAITLTNSVSGGYWMSADTTIARVNASGIVTGVAGGSVNVSYIVTGTSGCSASSTVTITVNALPVAGAISGTTALCTGSTTTYANSATGGVWSSSNPSVLTINSSTGVATGTSAGTTTISYTVVNASGCSRTVTLVVAVGVGMPTATITPGNATLCGGAPVHLTITTTATGISYQWYRNGVLITGATSSAYTASTAGVYSAIISNGCSVDTLAGARILAQPVPVITRAGASTLTTGSFSSYQWYLNGSPVAGATSSVYVFGTPGVYTVRVTDINGCSATSAGYTVSGGGGSTGVNEAGNLPSVGLYPNPTTAIVHIEAEVTVNAIVLSADGKVVANVKDAKNLDLGNFADGMYMIMIYDEQNMLLKVSKIVKSE